MPNIDIAKAVRDVLDQYADKVGDDLDEVLQKVAKDAKKEVAAASPKRTGAYAKGWSIENTGTRLAPSEVIYNKKPGLPHLLEHGHANRGGGRTAGIPHIAPVDDKLADMIIGEMEKRL